MWGSGLQYRERPGLGDGEGRSLHFLCSEARRGASPGGRSPPHPITAIVQRGRGRPGGHEDLHPAWDGPPGCAQDGPWSHMTRLTRGFREAPGGWRRMAAARLPSFPPSLPETAAKHQPPLLSLISVPWEMGLFLTWPRGQEPAPRGPAPGNGRSRECAGSAAATDSDQGRFLPTVSARWWLHAPGGPAAASRSARV